MGALTLTAAAALEAACAPRGAGKPTGTTPTPVVRVLTRTSYDPAAWDVVSAQDEQANVRVETEPGPDLTAAYGQKILTLAAADSLPDVIYSHPNFFSSVASRGLLRDHEQLAARARFDLKGIQRELGDSVRWTDGKLYAIPYSGVSYLLIVNVGLFRQRGVTPPMELEKAGRWNWDGFRQALARLTLRQPGQPPVVGMPEHLRGMQYQSHWIFGAGGEVWSKDLAKCLLDSRQGVSALEYLAALHNRDRVSVQPGEVEHFENKIQAGFTTGRVGVYFRATTEVQQVRSMADEGAQLGIAPIPRGPVARAPRGAANSWAVVTSSKEPEAAFRGLIAWHRDPLLDFLYRQRFLFPCRQSQFDHPAFKAALFPWEDLEVERAALREVRIMATPGRFTEIDSIWTKLWPEALYGGKSVKDVLNEFLPQANALLRT